MEEIKYIIQHRHYGLDLKHKICKEHIEGGLTLSELTKKYDLSSHSLIHDWLRKLGYLPPTYRQMSRRLYIDSSNQPIMPPNDKTIVTLNQAEQSEIALLKKKLEDAQIQLEGYQRIIEIAEKEYNIPIRKKSNTK